MLHQKPARLSLRPEEAPSGLQDSEPAPEPTEGVVNKMFIVLKPERLGMLLFQVKVQHSPRAGWVWRIHQSSSLDQNETSGHSGSTIQKGSALF